MNSPEPDYCSSAITYSSGRVTITGTATYEARQIFTTGAGGLGAAGAPQPIRFAEVRAINSATGAIAQCAETSGTGTFSLVLPQGSTSYTIRVSARARNSHAKVDVFDDPRYNNYYWLSTTTTASSSVSVGTLNAGIAGSVLGGAFNILDKIISANQYLTTQVGSCSLPGCLNFNVTTQLPKLNVYWKLGFNPGDYYSAGALSFYLPGYSRLFILGGENGDYDAADTDHFDNSVILHEYGHFLEDALFISDSPGGGHNGNKVIDPRLAWSEGWGDFFQGAVRGSSDYIDSIGNISGSTHLAFDVDLENQTMDVPANSGEGNFREFSVTRLMWDAIDNTPGESGGLDNISGAFNQIWDSLTLSTGWLNPNAAFRAIGLLHATQSTLGQTSWTGIRTIEKHTGSTADYAQYVAAGSSCASFSLTPAVVSGDNGSFSTSHLLLNNDFYHLHLAAGVSASVRLDYQDANGTNPEADADLYVYNKSARFGVTADMVGYSRKDADGNAATAEFESVTIPASSNAQDLLINVNVYTGGASVGTQFTYTLKLNGSQQLCPAALP